jgi:hypothetical protein
MYGDWQLADAMGAAIKGSTHNQCWSLASCTWMHKAKVNCSIKTLPAQYG